jgi:regulator of protease activity HflC (stomatin/prohibitin superfamily)
VRIKRADLPSGAPLESAFIRMRSARQQEATTIRAQGLKQAQLVRADADAKSPTCIAMHQIANQESRSGSKQCRCGKRAGFNPHGF